MMRLPTNGMDITLPSGRLLAGEYQLPDAGIGRLKLTSTNPATGESQAVVLFLDLWSPEGVLVQEWTAAGGLVVVGGSRAVVLSTDSLSVRAAVPFECKEFQSLDEPWIAVAGDLLFVASEWRVFCVDVRLAIRWCWTTLVHAPERWMLNGAPIVEGASVRICLVFAGREAEVELRIEDALGL